MRRLPMVIWLVVVLVAVVTGGCDAHRYDGRLVAVDSLMRSDPDSALAMLEALPVGSISTEGDRAYYGLLISQARYKAYVTATSDSDINRALAYYRKHSGEREKLTRSYIYKGAVMEELGHPDSAMYYYKSAEATAAPDDYFNLGYSKMRIGELYQAQVSQDSAAILCLKDAIQYFTLLNDTNYLIACYGDLGAICGTRYPDSTEYYLKYAIDLAKRYNPSKQYTYKSKLAGFNLYHKHDYSKANALAMDVVNNGAEDSYEKQFYYYAALSYLKLGLTDSAKNVLSIIPEPIDAVDSMNYYDVVSKIALAEDNMVEYSLNIAKSKALQSQFTLNRKEKELVKTDVNFQRQQANENVERANHRSNFLGLLIIIILIILVITIVLLNRRIKEKEEERAANEDELRKMINSLIEKTQQATQNDVKASTLVNYRIEALNELFNSIKFKAHEKNNKKKTIITLSGLLNGLSDYYTLLNFKLSNNFWEKIKLSVDGEYNGIATYVEQSYPDLTEREVRMFWLFCANISPQIIKICMNFTNARTATNYRSIIIKKKMGLDMTFDDYIEKYMKGEIE
jgi:hypothetical protein